MMALRRGAGFLPITSCTRPNLIVTRQSTLKKYLRNSVSYFKDSNKHDNTDLIKPQLVKPNSDDLQVGVELGGELNKTDISSIVDSFLNRDELSVAVSNFGLDENMYKNVRISFKKFCESTNQLPSDIHIIFSDILRGHGHVLDLVPYFLQHALLVYPYLKYKNELCVISDLTNPEMWYNLARSTKRKIFFHHGPTNSGKTYKALQRFFQAKRGIYCSPLKLLAHEVFEKANNEGIPCDLITGEEKRRALSDGSEANHISCTVEMAAITSSYDVAVIDEIQMIKDFSRGYAWSRALLGIAAKEIHLCGETGALQFITGMAERLGEEIECIQYKRLTKLYFEQRALEDFKNVQKGDCIICFSKREIFHVIGELEKLNIECAVIYGTLPPGTKAHQCKKFNDPNNSCNVLVATDAVGLGLNLNIRRIIFYNVEKVGEVISTSLALQIAGRAGRFNSIYDKGYVTAFKTKDVEVLRQLLKGSPETVTKAGLVPTTEQIETYSYYLPEFKFTDLIDLFSALCTLNEFYFMCDLTQFKRLADLLQQTPLPVKVIYTFCCAPVNINSILNQTLFVKFSKNFSLNEPITAEYMKRYLSWPLEKPLNTMQLEAAEEAFDCLDLYLWFANRFPSLFPDSDIVRAMEAELDDCVAESVVDIVRMVRRSESLPETSKRTEENLLEKGILTPFLLAKLKQEWLLEMKGKKDVKS